MSTVIIINPISGGVSPRGARARAQLALAVVDAHGDPAEVLMTEAVGHARELAKSAVRRGARLVMAWGGDGTISEVASALAFDEVRVEGLLAQVRLRIGDQTLTAIITRDAVEELKLRRGDEALAIVKSTEVMIAREAAAPPHVVAPRKAPAGRRR